MILQNSGPPASASGTSALGLLMRRGWIAIVLFTVLGIVGGALLTVASTKMYTASADVLVTATGVEDNTTQANARTNGTINLDTEAQLVQSATVATRAQALLSGGQITVAKLMKNVAVSVPANTEVLRIAYTAPSAVGAQSAAHAFAQAYLDDRSATAQGQLKAQNTTVTGNITALTATLKALSTTIASLPDTSADKAFDEAQRSLLTSQISALNQQLIQIQTTSVTPGRLLTDAVVPSSPSSPSAPLDLGAGAAVGLLIGLLVAWLRITHRRKVRRADELSYDTGLRVVSVIDSLRPNVVEEMGTPAAETYRRLLNLTASAVGTDSTLLVAGVRTSSVASAVVNNLAVASRRRGLSATVIRISDGGAAKVLTPGDAGLVTATSPESNDFTATSAALSQDRLDRLRSGGFLLVDVPSPNRTADAQTLSRFASGVLLVVESGSSVKAVRSVIAQFDAVGAPMLGLVVVNSVVDKAGANSPASSSPSAKSESSNGYRSADGAKSAEAAAAGDPSRGSAGVAATGPQRK